MSMAKIILKAAKALLVGMAATDNGTRFVSNASVFTEDNGTKSVKFDNID